MLSWKVLRPRPLEQLIPTVAEFRLSEGAVVAISGSDSDLMTEAMPVKPGRFKGSDAINVNG
jgi:hypothetical protein